MVTCRRTERHERKQMSSIKRVTVADVARLAGTSTAVVSYVFNDGPRPVAAGTKQKVLAAAAELGYVPNALAKALRSGQSSLVGVVAPDSSIEFFAELTRAIVHAVGQAGMLAVVVHAQASGRSERETIEALLSAQVQGLIVTTFEEDANGGQAITTGDRPLVFVHHRPAHTVGLFVPSDNHESMITALSHFREVHGIDRPTLWTGMQDTGPLSERAAAWRDWLGDDTADPIRSDYSSGAAAARFRDLWQDATLPSAIVAGTDQQARGILAAAYEAGVRVPEDLAIISLDGLPSSEFTAPPLTVVEQPLRSMAVRAVELLVDDPGAEAAPEPLGVLRVRRSCGCAPTE